jgi:hypothetical protein
MKCPDCKTREIGRHDHRCIPCAATRLDMDTVNALLGFPVVTSDALPPDSALMVSVVAGEDGQKRTDATRLTGLGFPGPRPVTPYSVRVLCGCGGQDPECVCGGSGELEVAPF